MSLARHEWTLRMTRRVRITGRLRMTSALHVGGGVGTTSITDAGVVRHADGRPFIPGSSLKGALRSHLERLVQADALKGKANSCLLYDPARGEGGEGPASWQPSAPDCPTPGWIDAGKDATSASEEDFAALCTTCTLFGSPILAGKIRIPDLEVDESTYDGQVEIRDGVGIDRDRGLAVDQVKFDYEVIPAGAAFDFEVSVDSPDDAELGLVAAGVRELQNGHLAVGGKTTRGLGQCVLEDLTIYDARLGDAKGLAAYLSARAQGAPDAGAVDDPDAFLDDCIDRLLA